MPSSVLTAQQYKALLTTLMASLAGYLAFSLWSGWEAVTNALAAVGFLGVLLALLMSLVNYGLRFIRWQGYLQAQGHMVAWQPSLRIYLAGFALTTTPGKAGEAIRGLLLKPLGVPWSHSLAAFFSERLSDLLAIVILSLFGLSLYPQLHGVLWIGSIGVLAGLLILAQHRLVKRLQALFKKRAGKLWQLLVHLLAIVEQAQHCHRWRQLMSASVLSLVAWGAEALAFYWILGWIGVETELQFAFFVYGIAMLAGALSFMPGGLGGAEAVMVGLLMWQGMPMPDAAAATVLIRLSTLWFAVLLGGVAISKSTLH